MPGAILLAWIVDIGVITVKTPDKIEPLGLPAPSVYLASVILYGLLGLGAKSSSDAAPFAALLAWGFTVAALLNSPLAPEALGAKLTSTKATNATSLNTNTPPLQPRGGAVPPPGG